MSSRPKLRDAAVDVILETYWPSKLAGRSFCYLLLLSAKVWSSSGVRRGALTGVQSETEPDEPSPSENWSEQIR